MALVRVDHGFRRYAFSVAYDGLNCLGFSYQGKYENCINPQGSDLRGLHSVEGKIRLALSSLVDGIKYDSKIGYGPESLWQGNHFENMQVSSRTDRSVHALKNTFHVDIRTKNGNIWEPGKLVKGLNFHMIRNSRSQVNHFLQSCNDRFPRHLTRLPENDVRITSCRFAPEKLLPNKLFLEGAVDDQPSHIAWNARFTATSRTYVYRILCHKKPDYEDEKSSLVEEYGYPFEANRSWRIHCRQALDMEAMKTAAQYLTGTHDFSSFRGKGCYRSSPFVTIEDISIRSTPILDNWVIREGLSSEMEESNNAQLLTISVKGNAFLYRQVRNIVGCLVTVGQQKISPAKVIDILEGKDRKLAPVMAPAHGLYLVHVEHGDFFI